MSLRKRPNSSIWWADFTVRGKRIRLPTGETDRKLAQIWHDRKRLELLNSDDDDGVMDKDLLSQWVLRWCKTEGRGMPDMQSINKFMRFYPDRPIRDAAKDEVGIDDAFRKFIKTVGTQERYVGRLKAIFNMAYKLRAIDRVPHFLEWATKSTKKRLEDREFNYLPSTAALKRLLDELPPHQKVMARFAVYTGLRRSNVFNLRWSEVNFANNTISVAGIKTKSGRRITFAMSRYAREVLVEVFQDQSKKYPGQRQDYVFLYRGKPIHSPKTAFYKACARAGFGEFTKTPNPKNKRGFTLTYKGLRWHDLRHTFATWHTKAGTDSRSLQALGGWHSEIVMKRYQHMSPSDFQRAAMNIDREFFLDSPLPQQLFSVDGNILALTDVIHEDFQIDNSAPAELGDRNESSIPTAATQAPAGSVPQIPSVAYQPRSQA